MSKILEEEWNGFARELKTALQSVLKEKEERDARDIEDEDDEASEDEKITDEDSLTS